MVGRTMARGLMAAVGVALAAIAWALPARVSYGQETKSGAAAYDDFKEPYRTKFVENWKKNVNYLKEFRNFAHAYEQQGEREKKAPVRPGTLTKKRKALGQDATYNFFSAG